MKQSGRMAGICLVLLTLVLGLAVGCNPDTLAPGGSSARPTNAPGEWYCTALATDAYEYPVTPLKTPDVWKTFTSHTQMLDAVAIPANVLAGISTPGLAEACINYPLCGDIIAFNSLYDGMKATESSFNGLPELYRRADGAASMLQLYRSVDVEEMQEFAEFGMLRLPYIECILANETLIAQMTRDERISLMEAVLEKHPPEGIPRFYWPHMDASFFLLGRLLSADSPDFRDRMDQDEPLRAFIQNGVYFGREDVEPYDIVEHAIRHLERVTTGTTSATEVPISTAGPTNPPPTPAPAPDTLRYFCNVIPWSAYSDAKVSQAEVRLPYDKDMDQSSFTLVDESLDLYYGLADTGNPPSDGFSFVKSILGICHVPDGTSRTFAQASSGRQALYMTADENYIVWRDCSWATGDASDSIMHVFIRATGEDRTFTMPAIAAAGEAPARAPGQPGLLAGDAYYFDYCPVISETTGIDDTSLYRYDIPTRTLAKVEDHAGKPFLFRGEPAWFRLDSAEAASPATPVNADGVIAALPVLPVAKIRGAVIADDVMVLMDPGASPAVQVEYAGDAAGDRKGFGLHVVRDGVATPVVAETDPGMAGVGSASFDRPKTNGRYVVIGRTTINRCPLLYDIRQGVIVEMDNLPPGAFVRGFSGSKLLFQTPPADGEGMFGVVIQWIDVDELP